MQYLKARKNNSTLHLFPEGYLQSDITCMLRASVLCLWPSSSSLIKPSIYFFKTFLMLHPHYVSMLYHVRFKITHFSAVSYMVRLNTNTLLILYYIVFYIHILNSIQKLF